MLLFIQLEFCIILRINKPGDCSKSKKKKKFPDDVRATTRNVSERINDDVIVMQSWWHCDSDVPDAKLFTTNSHLDPGKMLLAFKIITLIITL